MICHMSYISLHLYRPEKKYMIGVGMRMARISFALSSMKAWMQGSSYICQIGRKNSSENPSRMVHWRDILTCSEFPHA